MKEKLKQLKQLRTNVWKFYHDLQEWSEKSEIIEHIDKAIKILEKRLK